jgi:hypothetical protein
MANLDRAATLSSLLSSTGLAIQIPFLSIICLLYRGTVWCIGVEAKIVHTSKNNLLVTLLVAL